MTPDKHIAQEHLDAARDAVLGLDAKQAPTSPTALNERLSIGQDEVTSAVEMLLKTAKSKHLTRATPLVFTLLEAANRAFPEEMRSPIRSKGFVTSIAAVSGEAKNVAADKGQKPSPTRERQPVLGGFLDQALLAEGALPASLNPDERAGVVALALGTLRAIDRHLAGAEQPTVLSKTPGRNDPCSCGSGKKFKKCHGAPG